MNPIYCVNVGFVMCMCFHFIIIATQRQTPFHRKIECKLFTVKSNTTLPPFYDEKKNEIEFLINRA